MQGILGSHAQRHAAVCELTHKSFTTPDQSTYPCLSLTLPPDTPSLYVLIALPHYTFLDTPIHLTTLPVMANFMDLPKAVREKIYRLHLIADEQPVTFGAYKDICGYKTHGDDRTSYTGLPRGEARKIPPLLHASHKIEQEAAPIYFGDNTFAISGPGAMRIWKRFMWPRHVKYIRKLIMLTAAPWWNASNEAMSRLSMLSGLESLIVVIDEETMLRRVDRSTGSRRVSPRHNILAAPHRPDTRLHNLGLGPQVYLQLLRFDGIDGLRSLRGLKHVQFIKTLEAFGSNDPNDLGSLPGGLLETAKYEMMQPRHTKTPK